MINMARSVRPAPVEIAHKHMRFLIIHNPDKQGMDYFIKVRLFKCSHVWFM